MASVLGVAAIGVLMLPGCSEGSAAPDLEASTAAATMALPPGLKRLPPVNGDSVIMVDADGPQHGLRITPLNPMPGVGPQQSSRAYDLCPLLNFAGESGWRLLSRSEAAALERLKIMLVPGYGGPSTPHDSDHGEAWVQVTKQEKSNEIAENEALYFHSHAGSAGGMDWVLISEGFSNGGAADWDRYWHAKDDLARAIGSGHGGDSYEFAYWDLVENKLIAEHNLSLGSPDAYGVICAKQ
jgi:hypothetical protein